MHERRWFGTKCFLMPENYEPGVKAWRRWRCGQPGRYAWDAASAAVMVRNNMEIAGPGFNNQATDASLFCSSRALSQPNRLRLTGTV
jgi:hypothetical protein